MLSPGYQYRTSIDFGEVSVRRSLWVEIPPPPPSYDSYCSTITTSSFRHVEELVDGRKVIREMVADYMGTDYDLLRKNCCTFAHDASVRLGVPKEKIPTWFSNLAQTGAFSQDLATATLEPLQRVLSIGCGDDDSMLCNDNSKPLDQNGEPGFEIVAQRNESNTGDVVVVIDAEPHPPTFPTRTPLPWVF